MRTMPPVRGKRHGSGSLEIDQITPGRWAVVDYQDPSAPIVMATANTYWDLQRALKRSSRARRLFLSAIGYAALWITSVVLMVTASIVNIWASVLVVTLTAAFGFYFVAKVGDCVTVRRGLRSNEPAEPTRAFASTGPR